MARKKITKDEDTELEELLRRIERENDALLKLVTKLNPGDEGAASSRRSSKANKKGKINS
jgi:hypothetical protein